MKTVLAVLAVVAAILSRIRSNVTRWVRVAGRWVLETIKVADTSAPAPMAPIQSSASANEESGPIKRVAGIFAQGRRPQAQDLVGLADIHLMWLRECDRRQLCRILAANPEAIRHHVLGRELLRDVPGADADTVSALRQARVARGMREIDPASNRPRREKIKEMISELAEGAPAPL